MSTVTQHAPGTFCWTQLVTTDVEAAKKFYAGLFGWKNEVTTAGGNPITMILKDDKTIGAVMPLDPGQGQPSWTPFVAVIDADDIAARVRSGGGQAIIAPMEVKPNGRFGVFQDPTGAVFAVWQAGTKAGAEVANESGTMAWNELITTDATKAGSFYERVFGWKQDAMPMPSQPGRTYTVFKQGDTQAGGMMAATPEMHLTQPYWLTYYAVDDCDKSASKAEQLGAQVMMKPTDIPGMGRFAVIRDPQGAWFAIFQGA